MSEGAIEPYMIKKNKPKEHYVTSFWTSVIRSLVWNKQDGTIEYADFIFDPNGLAQTVINMGIKYENDNYRASTTPQFSKEVSLGIKPLLLKLQKMNIPNMWTQIAKNTKACLIESRLAMLRSVELSINEDQYLKTIDCMNSDCVEYMKKKHPLPKNVYLLPEPVQQKRDLLANQNDPEPKTLSVCILGYCNLA